MFGHPVLEVHQCGWHSCVFDRDVIQTRLTGHSSGPLKLHVLKATCKLISQTKIKVVGRMQEEEILLNGFSPSVLIDFWFYGMWHLELTHPYLLQLYNSYHVIVCVLIKLLCTIVLFANRQVKSRWRSNSEADAVVVTSKPLSSLAKQLLDHETSDFSSYERCTRSRTAAVASTAQLDYANLPSPSSPTIKRAKTQSEVTDMPEKVFTSTFHVFFFMCYWYAGTDS